jgi:ketosteroid isomerase-like protein
MSQADVDVTEQFLKAFAARDIEGVFALLHPEVVVHEGAGLPYAGEYVGAAGLQDLVGKIMTPMEMTLDSYQVSDGGDCAISRLEMTFTSRASGKVVKMPGVEIYNTTDGKVSRIDVYYKSTSEIADLVNG